MWRHMTSQLFLKKRHNSPQIVKFHHMLKYETCDEIWRFVTKDQKQKMRRHNSSHIVTFHHKFHISTCDEIWRCVANCDVFLKIIVASEFFIFNFAQFVMASCDVTFRQRHILLRHILSQIIMCRKNYKWCSSVE